MQINPKHLLTGEGITVLDTQNKGGVLIARYLVMHYTAGRDAKSSIRHLRDPTALASAHVVVGRDGSIAQLVPFDRVAWHAGPSAWAGLVGLNDCSIGIELDNAGKLVKVGHAYQAWFGATYPEGEVIRARHKNEDTDAWWHAYTEVQLKMALRVARLVVAQYKLADVLGHDDISPGRKVDPGPAFPMASFRSSILGRAAESGHAEVSAELLNIRAGPGAEFPVVAPPLPKGTTLDVVEMRSLWTHVVVRNGGRVDGWVRNAFIVAGT